MFEEAVGLVAGERSGVIRNAFNAAGIPFISCDLEPSDTEGPHMQRDWLDACRAKRWQIIICHYECTGLAVSGNAHYAAGKPKHHLRTKAIREAEALHRMASQSALHVAFENPRGILGTQSNLGPWSMSIQPYEFGEDASKTTDYWLTGLPPLVKHPELRVPGRMVEWPIGSGKMVERWSNQTDSGQNKLGKSPGRAAARAKTYQGWADAMVRDWGPLLTVLEKADV